MGGAGRKVHSREKGTSLLVADAGENRRSQRTSETEDRAGDTNIVVSESGGQEGKKRTRKDGRDRTHREKTNRTFIP